MKIATKIYLLTAGAAALIVFDAAVDYDKWRDWQFSHGTRHEETRTSRKTLRRVSTTFAELLAALRTQPAPRTREWTELGASGESAIAALRNAEQELQREVAETGAQPGDDLATAALLLQSARQNFERAWKDFRALPAESSAQFTSHLLVPQIEDELLGSLRHVETALREQNVRAEAKLNDEVSRERNRDLARSLALLALVLGGLYAIHRRFLLPLKRIEREARAVIVGDRINVAFTYTNDDELGALARAVNDTIDKLRSASFSREELERQVAARTAELHERERELQNSRAQLQRALDGSQLVTWEWDLVTDHVDFQSLATQILGYAPGEIPPTREGWRELVHPEDYDRTVAASRAHQNGEAPRYEVELRLRTKSGEWRWVRSLGRIAERDAAGRARRVIGINVDFTAVKASALAAAQQVNLYSALNETAIDLLRRRESADLLDAIVNRAATLLEAEMAEVALIQDGKLHTKAHRGPIPEEALVPAGPEAQLSWRAVRSGQPVLVHHYDGDDGARALLHRRCRLRGGVPHHRRRRSARHPRPLPLAARCALQRRRRTKGPPARAPLRARAAQRLDLRGCHPRRRSENFRAARERVAIARIAAHRPPRPLGILLRDRQPRGALVGRDLPHLRAAAAKRRDRPRVFRLSAPPG